eukprot:TRINITY_DN15068_c0_g1_i3.p6 TRINITY_DN15068_c0_g1~~TRINITY_DN15068_c0_g1_i3.p6  ORF type:complete len:126 (-),score=1.20 TRINITY_DN15068_c0_g1_i3:23-400(-)
MNQRDKVLLENVSRLFIYSSVCDNQQNLMNQFVFAWVVGAFGKYTTYVQVSSMIRMGVKQLFRVLQPWVCIVWMYNYGSQCHKRSQYDFSWLESYCDFVYLVITQYNLFQILRFHQSVELGSVAY